MSKLSQDELEELYVVQQLSLKKVAVQTGVSAQTILNWMQTYCIPRRTLSESWHVKTDEEKHLEKMWEGSRKCRGSRRWNWRGGIKGKRQRRGPDRRRLRRGFLCWNWRSPGARRNDKGYVKVKVADHPKGPWVYEHVLVMEQHIDRYLKPGEEIHHKNGVRADNRIENLELFASHSEHLRAFNHRTGRPSPQKGR